MCKIITYNTYVQYYYCSHYHCIRYSNNNCITLLRRHRMRYVTYMTKPNAFIFLLLWFLSLIPIVHRRFTCRIIWCEYLFIILCCIESETDCPRFTLNDNVFRVLFFFLRTSIHFYVLGIRNTRWGQWLLWFRDFCNGPPACFRCASVMFFVLVSYIRYRYAISQQYVDRQRAAV